MRQSVLKTTVVNRLPDAAFTRAFTARHDSAALTPIERQPLS